MDQEQIQVICHTADLDWGHVYTYVETNGQASAKAYTFKEEDDSIYLEALYVNEELRKSGAGTYLQELREDLGRSLGKTSAILWVVKDTWQHDWYKRRGYEDLQDRGEDPDTVWMQKKFADKS